MKLRSAISAEQFQVLLVLQSTLLIYALGSLDDPSSRQLDEQTDGPNMSAREQ